MVDFALDPVRWRAERKQRRRREIDMQGVSAEDIYKVLSEELPPNFVEMRRRERNARRAVAAKQHEMEAVLSTRSTRELLADLRMNRSSGRVDMIEWWALRKVLATRPHVWRGPKHHAWRSRLAQKQHGQGKSKNR